MEVCFATNNQNKIQEVANAVQNHFKILSLSELSVFDDLPETKDSFQGNAIQKAQFVFDKYGIACFADDSGLEVEALNGEPGVYSARYAGPQRNDDDNIQLVLQKLIGLPNRKARFITVIALVGITKEPQIFEGKVEGEITYTKLGTSGFGYDPIFRPSGSAKTFAEMSLEEKNCVSHRSIAVKKLSDYLNKISIS